MTSEADIAIDIDVAIETAIGSGEYTALLEVTDIELPDAEAEEHDVTHMKSPNRTREFKPGLVDPGEISIKINWKAGNATDVELNSLKTSREVRGIKITFPDASVWTFSAFVKGYKREVPLGDTKTATVKLRLTGSTAIA